MPTPLASVPGILIYDSMDFPDERAVAEINDNGIRLDSTETLSTMTLSWDGLNRLLSNDVVIEKLQENEDSLP